MAEKRKPVKKVAGSKKASSAKKAATKKAGASGAKKTGARRAATSSPRVSAGGGMSGSGGTPAHADIEERAFYISEREGGDPEQNWLRAERELREEKG